MFEPLIGAIISLIILIITIIGAAFGCAYGKDDRGNDYSGGGAATALTPKQNSVIREFKQLKAPKVKQTFNQFCWPEGGFKVQRQQQFAAEYMQPRSGNDVMLVFHRIGAGKTCLSIKVGQKWTNRGKPLYVMPASLIPGFRSELRGACGGFISAADSKTLTSSEPGSSEYKAAIKRSDALIDETFQIYSYNKFATAKRIKAPIIIVDEVQNINNPQGKYYKAIRDWIENNPDSAVVLMSATPLFDSPDEINSLADLMRIDRNGFEISPMDIRKLFDGKISYFAGAPDYTYPEVHMKIRKCKMSRHQTQWYRATVEAEMKATGDVRLREISDSFYIKSRQRSNIVYPLGLTGQSGLDALTPAMIRDNLEVYSTKYATLLKKLSRGGLSFIYTGFTGAGGIAALVKCLLAVGYVDYYDQYDSKGHKRKGRRFVIWSGEQTAREKDEIRAVFNSSENDNGSQIQIVIGSPAIKEGVSLLRVRSVHLIEPYWNKSRIEQIFGRAVRYCSHKSLPRDERSVTIYIYMATASGPEEKKSPLISIDNYMLDCAARKTKEMEPYISQMIDIAVDRGLW